MAPVFDSVGVWSSDLDGYVLRVARLREGSGLSVCILDRREAWMHAINAWMA